MTKLFLIASAMIGLFLSSSATAQTDASPWPTQKKIRLIVPFPAGGGADAIARIVAPALAEELGQSIYIDNRAGAAGSLGTQTALREKADGYTLIYVTNGTLITNPSLYAQVDYKLDDFMPVARLTDLPLVLAVRKQPDAPTSVEEFLTRAKKSDTSLRYGSAGIGTTSHFAAVMLSECTGLTFEHIPYRGGFASMTDLLAGRIDFTIDVATNTMPHVKAGALIALGLSTQCKNPEMNNIAMLGQQLPGYQLSAWDGIAVKAGTSPIIVKQLSEAINRTLERPEVVEALTLRGAELVKSSPESFKDFIESEKPRWDHLVESAKAQAKH